MADRNAKGRFLPGHSIKSPGRPPQNLKRYKERLEECLTVEDFDEILKVVVDKAKNGELEAVKVIFSYVLAKPAQAINVEERSLRYILKVEAAPQTD